MTKVQTSQINGALSYNADNVYADLKVCSSSQGLTYGATAGDGMHRIAALGVASDQSFSCGMETEEVGTGAIETPKDDLILKLTGEASVTATDLNPHLARFATGTTLEIQWQTTSVSGTVAASGGAVTGVTLEDATQAGSFSVNDVMKVPLSSGTNLYYWPAIVAGVSGATVTFKYAIPAAPADSAEIFKLLGYDIFHGGNVIHNLHALIQLDFPKGEQHILDIFKCSMTGGFTRSLGGAVKTPASMKMYGEQQDVGSLTGQIVCAATRAQFPNT